MAEPNPALLARTARTLRERFEALRPLGEIPAVLAESPLGHSHARSGPGNTPELPFDPRKRCRPQFVGACTTLSGGKPTGSKELWLCCEPPEGERLREVCKAAAPFVPMIRRTHGLPTDCGTTDRLYLWIWTVFALAESRVPYSLLELEKGSPLRFSESGNFTTTQATLDRVAGAAGDPVAQIFSSQTWSPVRYLQLADLIEASIMVMDLVEAALPSVTNEATAPKPLGVEEIRTVVAEAAGEALAESKKDRKPRGETTCERLRRLHTNIDPEFAETASLRKLGARIGRSTGSIGDSTYYQTKLKPIREEIAARKKAAKAAQKWGDFDSVGRRDEDSEAH